MIEVIEVIEGMMAYDRGFDAGDAANVDIHMDMGVNETAMPPSLSSIPPASEDQPLIATALELSPSDTPPWRILVVDDSRHVRFLFRTILEAEGYKVLTAEDGITGLEAALRESPQLLIVDLVMPHMDGLTMIERLRTAERTLARQRIPVIILTALSEQAIDTNALAIKAILDKARVSQRTLARTIRAALADNTP